MIGIETDRGPWVQALIAGGYQIHAINPCTTADVDRTAALLAAATTR